MSETYQAKRERWQRLLESLPARLREHVSLRNAEAVAALPAKAQERLAEAINSGLKRLPRAVEQLRLDPDTSVAELLRPPVVSDARETAQVPGEVQKELAGLIQSCFPDMPRISAEALAEAEAMDMARQIVRLHTSLFQSDHLRTDFVMMVVYGLMRQSLERLDDLLDENPALRQRLVQSDLPWKPKEWR